VPSLSNDGIGLAWYASGGGILTGDGQE